MKKCALVTLMMAFLVVMASSYGLAQISGAANTSKEGSLLIWPKIQTNDGNETYIMLTNNSPNEVQVQCFWEIKDVPGNPVSQCLQAPFVMHLSGNTPIVFRASDGAGLDGRAVAAPMDRAEKGVLKCWAVDPTASKQISWNHLGGFAVIVNSDATAPDVTTSPTSAWEYSAWRFAANVTDFSGVFVDGFWVGPVTAAGYDANVLNLKASPTTTAIQANCPGPTYSASGCNQPNAAYDACPKYLTFDFLAEPSGPTKTDGTDFNNLALVPCKDDLTCTDDCTAANPSTKINYTVWNENEVKYIGIYQCASCAYESYFAKLKRQRNVNYFMKKYLNTPSGRVRVQGLASCKCGEDSISTPLIGVLSAHYRTVSDISGTTGTTSGKETSDYGYIKYVPEDTEYYQKPKR
jgi:hypothetical protein